MNDPRLLYIAIANGLIWTGLFLFLLFRLMSGNSNISDRLAAIEARHKDELPK